MIKRKVQPKEEVFNPFEVKDNSAVLLKALSSIDSKDLRTKFKATTDPIHLAFDTIENASLKSYIFIFQIWSLPHTTISYLLPIVVCVLQNV